MENINNISNAEFERALNNIDNQKIMNRVVKPFRSLIDKDELHRCKLIALWESMMQWVPGQRKFSSMLYQKLHWACLGILKDQKRRYNRYRTLEFDPIVRPDIHIVDAMDIFTPLLPNLRDIMIKRFIYRMTLREISEIYGCCKETIRRRILLGIKILNENENL